VEHATAVFVLVKRAEDAVVLDACYRADNEVVLFGKSFFAKHLLKNLDDVCRDASFAARRRREGRTAYEARDDGARFGENNLFVLALAANFDES
jgi:hypothetical protein